MNAKLIKTIDCYELFTQGFLKGSTNHELIDSLNIEEGSIRYKLSLKNCQVIERGYDLDVHSLFLQAGKEYLGDSFDMLSIDIDTHQIALVAIKKALELIRDKEFSKKDMLKSIIIASSVSENKMTPAEIIKSLLLTEWDVEIEMEQYVKYVPKSLETVYPTGGVRPKLDTNGCLILKRV